MIHYNRIKVGQRLVVGAVQSLFKTDADGERVEKPHVLKPGETVMVAELGVDQVTVVTEDGRKATFAHSIGASKLSPLPGKPAAQPPPVPTGGQQHQQQQPTGGESSLD